MINEKSTKEEVLEKLKQLKKEKDINKLSRNFERVEKIREEASEIAQNISEDLKKDFDIQRYLIYIDALMLKYLQVDQNNLEKYKHIAYTAVDNNPRAIRYAYNNLVDGKIKDEYIQDIIKKCNIKLVPFGIEKENIDKYTKMILSANGMNLQYNDEIQDNKELVLIAVKQNGMALEYASKELQNDKEVVMAAVKNNPEAIKYASEELQNNPFILLGLLVSKTIEKKITKSGLKEETEDKEIIADITIYVAQNGKKYIKFSDVEKAGFIKWSDEIKNDPKYPIRLYALTKNQEKQLKKKFSVEYINQEVIINTPEKEEKEETKVENKKSKKDLKTTFEVKYPKKFGLDGKIHKIDVTKVTQVKSKNLDEGTYFVEGIDLETNKKVTLEIQGIELNGKYNLYLKPNSPQIMHKLLLEARKTLFSYDVTKHAYSLLGDRKIPNLNEPNYIFPVEKDAPKKEEKEEKTKDKEKEEKVEEKTSEKRTITIYEAPSKQRFISLADAIELGYDSLTEDQLKYIDPTKKMYPLKIKDIINLNLRNSRGEIKIEAADIKPKAKEKAPEKAPEKASEKPKEKASEKPKEKAPLLIYIDIDTRKKYITTADAIKYNFDHVLVDDLSEKFSKPIPDEMFETYFKKRFQLSSLEIHVPVKEETKVEEKTDISEETKDDEIKPTHKPAHAKPKQQEEKKYKPVHAKPKTEEKPDISEESKAKNKTKISEETKDEEIDIIQNIIDSGKPLSKKEQNDLLKLLMQQIEINKTLRKQNEELSDKIAEILSNKLSNENKKENGYSQGL